MVMVSKGDCNDGGDGDGDDWYSKEHLSDSLISGLLSYM